MIKVFIHKKSLDLVRLQRSGSRSEDRLVGLLSTIFVSNLTPIEKKTVLSLDYNVPVDEHMERMVANMCNYSSYVLNKGIQQGMQQGIQKPPSATLDL